MAPTALLLDLAQDFVFSEEEHLAVTVLNGHATEIGQKDLVASGLRAASSNIEWYKDTYITLSAIVCLPGS